MKYIISIIYFSLLVSSILAQPNVNKKITLNCLEDFFRFENVEQLESYFGLQNVFTGTSFYGDPNQGSKPYLISQVKSNTPQSVLVVWNGAGDMVCEVKTSANYYDLATQKLMGMPNVWKTKQGVFAGISLSNLVRINRWDLSFYTQFVDSQRTVGKIILENQRLRERIKVPLLDKKLIYEYVLDTNRIKDYFPETLAPILKSNNERVKEWNPVLELISIYMEGLKPEDNN